MTKWLASVQSRQEAASLLPCLPDIIDMKQPSAGALGALPVSEVAAIVDLIDSRCLTSATIGDLPMQTAPIISGLQQMATSGVDYLKIGLFAGQDREACLRGLKATLTSLSTPVIAVVFADQPQHDIHIEMLAEVGFAGVMVDTANKDGRSLLQHWSLEQIKAFTSQAKSAQILCGLAGALRIEDIACLKPLSAHYLGFRSALCAQRQRQTVLLPSLAEQIRQQLTQPLEMTG
jgi:uncharacterized protein (UPF0264 family)